MTSSADFALIGGNLGHSFSKLIHERLGMYSYELINLTKEEVADFIRGKKFKGLNVTIPYKETVMDLLDEIDSKAERIGAVNTIVNDNGRLKGYNTDYDGFKFTLDGICDVQGKKVLVLGAGGASKAVTAVLRDCKASSVVVSASRARGDIIDNNTAVLNHSDADIIINTSPVGMTPDIENSPINLDSFAKCKCVVDIIYNPNKTALMMQAEKLGMKTVNGLGMLVMQAKKAAELFTSSSVDDGFVKDTVNFIKERQTNIVLIGMPSCGKSVIGKKLADITGKTFVDTDSMVEDYERESIKDIFDKHGESYFRSLEHNAVRAASLMSGCVIATGGGVIKDIRNMELLKHNGVVVFLDRPFDNLLAYDEKRPLSCGIEALKNMYDERYGVYREYADMSIPNDGDIKDTLDKIAAVCFSSLRED